MDIESNDGPFFHRRFKVQGYVLMMVAHPQGKYMRSYVTEHDDGGLAFSVRGRFGSLNNARLFASEAEALEAKEPFLKRLPKWERELYEFEVGELTEDEPRPGSVSKGENGNSDLERLQRAAVELGLTRRQGYCAYGTWAWIILEGQQTVRERMNKSTWYRHVRILKAGGLSLSDVPARKVVPFPTKPLIMTPVHSWADMGIVPPGEERPSK